MTNFKQLIKLFICLQFVLSGLNANAQIAILQHTIDQLANYKNFSYQNVYKQKEVFSDTLIAKSKIALLKTSEDNGVGYLFKSVYINGDMKVPTTYLYDGKSLTTLFPADSTYWTSNRQAMTFDQLLLRNLDQIKTFSEKHPSKLLLSADTVFHSINSYHLVFTIRDTMINKDHVYVKKHLFIDKLTGLPVGIVIRARTADFGKEVTNYFTEDSYLEDCKFFLPDL